MVDHLFLPDFVLAGKEGLAFFCPVPCLTMIFSSCLYHTDCLATPRKCLKLFAVNGSIRYTLVNVPGGLLAIDLGFQGSYACHPSICLCSFNISSTLFF